MVKASLLFFASGVLAMALGISGKWGAVPFERGRTLLYAGLIGAIGCYLWALVRRPHRCGRSR